MARDRAQEDRLADLRKRAEAGREPVAEDIPHMSTDELRTLVHDLQTHRIELEMQNDELRRIQEELVESRDRYTNLYNFAPVGYVTVSDKGMIVEANLTLSAMLGVDRGALVGHPLSAFVAREDQDVLYLYRKRVLGSHGRETCQVRMRRPDAGPIWTEMDTTRIEADDESDSRLLVAVSDITERRRAEASLSEMATHDTLTGLINRVEFERRLGRVLESARERHDEHALCYMDLDQFKVVNDTCGHAAGDMLLRQLTNSLSAAVRKRDTLARLGGDEFGVLVEHCTLSQVRRIANKIRRTIAAFRFIWEDRVFRLGVSIGVVAVTDTSESVSSLLSAADSACYVAKDEGRNRVHVYHLDDLDIARRRGEMRWVGRINQALEDGRFQLWSQRIVPVGGSFLHGDAFELLLRLVDEQGGIILPEDFLPPAERYGLATKLDRWVIGAVLAWLGRNPHLLAQVHLCFVNLSGASVADEEFLEFVLERLSQSQVPSQKICFEVTETAAMANLSRAIEFMVTLKAQGCRFALDDFGRGLSSFAYLKTLPVDFLKIDGGFVRDILDDEVDLALVRAFNDVGQVMGKLTIAEAVESEAVLAKLHEVGVDYAQGFVIGQPALIEDNLFSPTVPRGRP
jgi:diguanylate cyclase (GGDEF)-like protein/PAS domain S-box-containing protein